MKCIMSLFLIIIAIAVGLSALIIIHELGHFLVAKWLGLFVEEFGFGLPPRIFGKKIGETVYSLNWLPFGGFVRIFGERPEETASPEQIERSFAHQPVAKRAIIVVAGVIMNFALGWLLLSSVFAIGIPQSILVSGVQKGGIADIAGIQQGDQFIEFKTVPEFVEFLEVNKGAEVRIAIKRGGETFPVKFVPRVAVPEGEGNIGVFLDEIGLLKQNFFRSFLEGFKLSLQITKAIFAGIVQLVVGVFTDISILDRFVGPVGIVSVAIGTARAGFVQFLQLLALISLNLAVFNVFPIPALDGGRLLFLMLEKLRGKPINMHTEMVINGVSFFILLILIGAVTVKDIVALL